jgi:D-erythronate 2-dehydrogenase
MNILVTGGSGFLGQQLIQTFLQQGFVAMDGRQEPISSITSLDQGAGQLAHERLHYATGDISDANLLRQCVTSDTALIVHLAAVVSGTAEADFELGMRVNLDGTRALLEACRLAGQQPRVVFASSVATFGGVLPEVVTDATTPTPQGSYGIQKLLGELLIQDYSRKGFIDGRSLRVPTVVVRPGKPNGAASSFASGMVREPLQGVASVVPVSMETQLWLIARQDLLACFLHAIELPAQAWGLVRSVNLPGMTASVEEALEALRRVGGESARALVSQATDPAIVKIVNTWPARFDTARALSMGFIAPSRFEDAVRDFKASLVH